MTGSWGWNNFTQYAADQPRSDLVVGLSPGQPPAVKVFDAVSLAVLDDFFAYDPALLGGVFVGGA